jgi:Leucine Rich repeat
MAVIVEKLRAATSNAVKELNLNDNALGDAGALHVARLLGRDDDNRGGASLEEVYLDDNDIGHDGVEILADALRHNTTLLELTLEGNPGVDASVEGSSDADVAEGIDELVSAIGVNTTLKWVRVNISQSHPHQKRLNAALADTEGRRAGRDRFLAGPLTKAART